MTIPEAVSLVLQAGAMADKRKVFVLEMGKPVKIIELARQMIRLAGHRPDEDIQIEIVGTRPGERLHESLHDAAEIVEPTRHPSIRGLTPRVPTDPTRLSYFRDVLRRSCSGAPDQVVVGLLDQMLAECGVECHLDADLQAAPVRTAPRRALHAAADLDLASTEREETSRPRRNANLPALLGGDANVRSGPAVRSARRGRRSSVSSAASSRLTTGACSPTARS